jgi:hypothetical protein
MSQSFDETSLIRTSLMTAGTAYIEHSNMYWKPFDCQKLFIVVMEWSTSIQFPVWILDYGIFSHYLVLAIRKLDQSTILFLTFELSETRPFLSLIFG